MGKLPIPFYPDTKSIADLVGEKYVFVLFLFFYEKKKTFCIYDRYIHFWCSVDCCIGNEFKQYGSLKNICVHLAFVSSNFKALHLMLSWSFQ